MPSSVVVEQQAKLGVPAAESKTQRLKRQQARFRDRGGAFVPSTSNPLVDILLARTVSGESPSKVRPKDVTAKPKPRRASTRKAGPATVTEENQAMAGSSKSKPPASRKRKAKATEPEVEVAIKPTPKRRAKPAKGKQKVPDSDTEHPLSDTNAKTKTKTTSKGKGKQRNAALSTSDGNPKTKMKPRAKAKPKLAKEVVEVAVSDDDQTLVDVPHKAKSHSKKNLRYGDDGETDDDAPIVKKRAKPQADDSPASGSKTAIRAKTEVLKNARSSGKKSSKDGEERSQDGKHPETNVKRGLALPDDGNDDDDVAAPPTKKGKVGNSTSAKRIKSEPSPRITEDVKSKEEPKTTDRGKGNGRAGPRQHIVEALEEDDDERPPEGVSKPKKRKKEADNHDDRPRKTVKFSETGPPHSSSQKLKENQSERKYKSAVKPSIRDEPDAPRPELVPKPTSRAKTPKGPPREVLERIKASAAQHLRCADGEPDELDCLS